MVRLEDVTPKMEDITLNPGTDGGKLLPTPPELAPPAPAQGPQPPPTKSIDEVIADLQKSPLFMTELVAAEDNDDIAALQALAYEGTPLENASDFKARGNECFKVRGYADAREFYKKGIDILWLEERKRRLGGKVDWLPEEEKESRVDEGGDGEEGQGGLTAEEREEEEERRERDMLATLYINRAACNLATENYRSVWLDCMAALRLNPLNTKGYYRAAKALLAVDRIAEADDICARGLELEPSNKALVAAADEIIKRNEYLANKKRLDDLRQANEQRKKTVLAAALRARGIKLRTSPKPPDMEDAHIHLAPDGLDPTSSLVVPVMLLYPLDYQSDFVKAFNEQDTLAIHFAYILPPPWDDKGRYAAAAGVQSFVENSKGGLLKVGKNLSLLKVLQGGNVEVVDEVVRIFVVPNAGAEGWVRQFKERKGKEMAA